MRSMKISITAFIILLIILGQSFAQQRITQRGDATFRKEGVHRGNQVRTVFGNYGVIARQEDKGPRGAWKFDANGYVGDVSPIVGVRLPVKDYDKNDTLNAKDTIFSTIVTPVERPGGGDFAPGGKSWTFEPIPGFAQALLIDPKTGNPPIGKGVAMSHQPDTWPNQWPDYPTWNYTGEKIIVDGKDITPKVDWNGYFGRAQFNADQESYFWMDDNNDEKMFVTYGYFPDTLSPQRRGQALQVSVRGMQWANFLAQDVIFWLYNIKNDGTETYDQTVFATLVGTYLGVGDPEWNDDASFFNIREAITYTYDFDHYITPSANPKWRPDPSQVGYLAYAFLESPGSGRDGIDNDADNVKYKPTQAKFFVENNFKPRTVAANEKLIYIEKQIINNKIEYVRKSINMASDTMTLYSLGVKYFLKAGVTVLTEGEVDQYGKLIDQSAYDGIDNDLDGLIDENYLIHYRQLKKTTGSPSITLIDTLNPVHYIDYIASVGTTDKMIDERRDDAIDNDGDWSRDRISGNFIYDDKGHLIDDVGADGKPYTNDAGEYDGLPTSGEPNFDQTDVDESDQLGLTTFDYFVPSNDIKMNNENEMWNRMRPGYFRVPETVVNNVATKGEDGDFIFASGYFPLLPGETQRFSLALAYGEDFAGVLKTKRVAQLIYNSNYNFPKPPDKPTLTVVPGNNQVTLYWDRIAENSIDPTTKEKDFEGYKIYRGTDPDFTDALKITNGSGEKVFLEPIAQFDLKNGFSGYFVPSANLYQLTNGAPFYLGSDNGIQNSFVDKNLVNGRTYYYAVVAYDRGKTENDIYPSENTRFLSKDATGVIQTDKNTAAVVPNAPVLGYVPPTSGKKVSRISGGSTVEPYFEVVDPTKTKNTTYVITFKDSVQKGANIAYAYSVKDSISGNILIKDNTNIVATNGDVFDGIRLSIDGSFQSADSIKLNKNLSGWKINNPLPAGVYPLRFTTIPFYNISGTDTVIGGKPAKDYLFVFNNTYNDSSNDLDNLFKLSIPVKKKLNFKIYDVTEKTNIKQVKFIMVENSLEKQDTLSYDDIIVLSNAQGTEISWEIVFTDSIAYVPKDRDSLLLTFYRPISSVDKFYFTANRMNYDANIIKDNLNKIKAVPNPYVVTNVFEQPLPPTVRGRGERIINFISLPPKSKIHIYTSSGNHIRTLQHDGDLNDGSVSWDLKTKEGLDVAYGVYFYVVEIEGISDKKYGKLAIIK